jgi:hypothetical protein
MKTKIDALAVLSAHDAVHMLRLALVQAECAIKGREHTGFITRALVATEHIGAERAAIQSAGGFDSLSGIGLLLRAKEAIKQSDPVRWSGITHDIDKFLAAPISEGTGKNETRFTVEQVQAMIAADRARAASRNAGVVPELKNAFITLESAGGEGRTIVLKFNQRADAYAVHGFLLKGGVKESPAATEAPDLGVRDAALEEAAVIADYQYQHDGDDTIHNVNAAMRNTAEAIRALKDQPAAAVVAPVEAVTDTQRLDYLEKYAVIAKPGQPVREAIDSAILAKRAGGTS